jgi:hypothetical protein
MVSRVLHEHLLKFHLSSCFIGFLLRILFRDHCFFHLRRREVFVIVLAITEFQRHFTFFTSHRLQRVIVVHWLSSMRDGLSGWLLAQNSSEFFLSSGTETGLVDQLKDVDDLQLIGFEQEGSESGLMNSAVVMEEIDEQGLSVVAVYLEEVGKKANGSFWRGWEGAGFGEAGEEQLIFPEVGEDVVWVYSGVKPFHNVETLLDRQFLSRQSKYVPQDIDGQQNCELTAFGKDPVQLKFDFQLGNALLNDEAKGGFHLER